MTSVLDQMTAATRQRKEDKAATLTPVGTETIGRSRIPDVPEVFLTGEALTEIAKDLRAQAEVLIRVADGLDGHVGRSSAAPLDTRATMAEATKAAERAADAAQAWTPQTQAIIDRMASLSTTAQASAFVPGPVDEPAPAAASGSTAEGWVCPTHGDAHLNDLTSRKGRKYRACTACTAFEKEVTP